MGSLRFAVRAVIGLIGMRVLCETIADGYGYGHGDVDGDGDADAIGIEM
jgi:hypothetical protein